MTGYISTNIDEEGKQPSASPFPHDIFTIFNLRCRAATTPPIHLMPEKDMLAGIDVLRPSSGEDINISSQDMPATPPLTIPTLIRRSKARTTDDFNLKMPELPPASYGRLAFYLAREHAPSFTCGAALGVTKIGVRYAAAALAITMPYAAMVLGGMAGGTIKLIQEYRKTNAEDWSWKRGAMAFGTGTVVGAVGAGLGHYVATASWAHHALGGAGRFLQQSLSLSGWYLPHLSSLHMPHWHSLFAGAPLAPALHHALLTPALPNPDYALKNLINQDSAFKGHEKLRKAALTALKKHDWKHLSMRFADAGYFDSMKAHHHFTKHSAALWQKAAEIVNNHSEIIGHARNHILKNAAFVARLHPAV